MNTKQKTKKQERDRQCFTLVELLAAMAIFVILMAVMFEFLGGAQQVWSLSKSNAKIYENARVAMDLISRDIQSAVTSDFPGQEIPFYYDKDQRQPTMVSATNLTISGSRAKLAEVTYETNSDNQLVREVACDNGSSPTYWDFYGDTASPTPAWVNNDPSATSCDTALIVDGVKSASIICYRDGAEIPASPDTETNTTVLPNYAEISLTLFDPDVPEQNRDKTQRTFTRTVYFRSGK